MYISRSTITMTPIRVLRSVFILLLSFCTLSCADELSRVSNSVCPTKSIQASILGFDDSICQLSGTDYYLGVIEGDETSLQKALSIIDTNTHDYIVVLFYASWCQFSMILRPSLSAMSSLYPSIPHFAIKESVVKPSILSKYGVNGLPSLFVINSTMRARYHGSRTLTSLVTFYTSVTGVKADLVDKTSLDNMETVVQEKVNRSEPENLLEHDTYLALATVFVIFRSIYLSYPFIITSAQYARRKQIFNIQIWDHPFAYLSRAIQFFSSLTGCMGLGSFHEHKH